MTRVRFHKPDNNWDVVGDGLVGHGDRTVGLEEIDGAAVVVSVGGGFGFERREGGEEREEVLTDKPFGVFGVRESGGAALGED